MFLLSVFAGEQKRPGETEREGKVKDRILWLLSVLVLSLICIWVWFDINNAVQTITTKQEVSQVHRLIFPDIDMYCTVVSEFTYGARRAGPTPIFPRDTWQARVIEIFWRLKKLQNLASFSGKSTLKNL